MNNALHDKEIIKAYLLGKISDEETLAGIEESLFSDEEFTNEIELAEDEIINDYVFGNLSAEDREAAAGCFFKTAERQFKLKLTQNLKEKASAQKIEKPSFVESLKAFFPQPAYVGAFAVLLIAAIGFSIYLFRDKNSAELAALQTIYQKERPVQTRISALDYAPLNIVRGANENQENINRLRRIEINFLEAVEKSATAENRHNLGVYYLTQRKFTDAIRELEKAARLDDKNAKILSDLGSAYFESARAESIEKKRETLVKANESFSRAVELDANLLEALFNKSLCLQELTLYNEAKQSWQKYLEKDSTSGWADEARKNLESLENLKTTSKTKEQVLEDFLVAYRAGDREFAWIINCQTKEMITEVWLPDQLTRRYLETQKSQESIDALKFIGEFEKTRNADFFVAELAAYYSKINDSQIENLLKAKNLMRNGYKAIEDGKNAEAILIFEDAAKTFASAGNDLEEKAAEYWAAQGKPREGKVAESLDKLNPLAKYFDEKKYRWFYGETLYWISQNYFFQNEFTKAISLCKESFDISKEISDSHGTQKNISCLTDDYNRIGELSQSLRFLSQIPDPKDLYYASRNQNWRNYYYSAKLFDRMQMFSTAENFGKESLILAKDVVKNPDFANSSLELLAKISVAKRHFDEALSFANESKTLAQNKPEGRIKTFILAKSSLQIADSKRQTGQCVEALSDYDAAILLYSQIPEIRLNDFAVHKGKLLCYQELNRQNELQAELETVLNLSENYRSQILKDDERQAFFDNEQIVYDVAVENALGNGDAAKAFELAENSKARSLLDFVGRKTSEEEFSEVLKPLSLTEIQARMPENVQVVQFAVLPKKSVVWTVTKTEIKTFKIDVSAESFEKKILDYLNLITEKSGKTEIEKSGKELYALFVKPILPALDSSKEICLIPDKALHQLPFEALISESGKFLLEDFKMFYSPSASVFVFATEKALELEKIKDENLLSIGNPAFDKEENAGLAALPSAEEEARAITKFYPKAKQFFGVDATKVKFLDELPNAEIVHFAGHYVANAESPSFSKLLFSAVGQDGDLRSFEITGRKLPKLKLVVLSACQTGIEKFYKGEGAIGIARTFLAVGTPVVVASRWKVDSDATKDLMIAFHRNRREKNMSIAEALRQAQIEMLKGGDENFRQPYFWSAFSMIGGSANY